MTQGHDSRRLYFDLGYLDLKNRAFFGVQTGLDSRVFVVASWRKTESTRLFSSVSVVVFDTWMMILFAYNVIFMQNSPLHVVDLILCLLEFC